MVVAKNSIRCLSRAYKSFIKIWFRRKKSSSSTDDNNPRCSDQTQQEPVVDDKSGKNANGIHNMGLNGDASREDDLMTSPRLGCCLCRHRSLDISRLPSTSRNNTINSRKRNKQKRSRSVGSSENFIPTPSSLNSSISGNLTMPSRMQSRNGSSRRSGTPIMYSNSSGRLKPPPIEKNIECTLDELCHGCKKTVMITRDVLTDIGGVVQEEELLTINVEPGWKKGTKIKFEGKGNERPNYAYSEDIIFYISEKRHQFFRREGDDLELCVEIPLLKALTGCTITVPLLGGEHMNLTLDEIIYPGYQKIITDQGMPISTEPEKRGNLIITFLVEFPTHLTDNQRSDVFGILQNSC